MIVYGQTGAMDRWGQPRQKNPMLADGQWKTTRNEAALLDFVGRNTTPSFEIPDCPYVLFTVTQSADGGFAVHLLNYLRHTLDNVLVRYEDGGRRRLLALTPGCDQIRRGPRHGEWIIPKLGVYSILVAED